MINLPSQMQRFLNHCKIRKALNDKTIKAYKNQFTAVCSIHR